jgi:hypothetical protein
VRGPQFAPNFFGSHGVGRKDDEKAGTLPEGIVYRAVPINCLRDRPLIDPDIDAAGPQLLRKTGHELLVRMRVADEDGPADGGALTHKIFLV